MSNPIDENKICFIIASNDETMLRECMAYVKRLVIPNEYIIETIIIREAPSMTKAYNTAMKSSTAKYKVYLHQDLFIIYKDFIKDFTNTFINCPKLGMIGVAGTTHLANHAIWSAIGEEINCHVDYIDNICQDMTNKKTAMDFSEPYQKLEVIDGLIMITQYDIPWREDIFDDYHFYDMSQSIEFLRVGYDVGIAKQKNTWCLHKCDRDFIRVYHSKEKYKFIEEYIS